MNIRDAIDRDFRMLDASWPRIRALEIASRSRARWFIVRHANEPGTDPLYYVLDGTEVREKLEKSHALKTYHALKLFSKGASAAIDEASARGGKSVWQVVLAGKVPVGILKPAATHRGATAITAGQRGPSLAGGDAAVVSRDLDAHWPESIETDSILALLVSLAVPGAEGANTVSLKATLGTRIDVVVRPLQGLTLEGTNTGTLMVSDPQDAAPLMFRFKAGAAGNGSVRIYAYSGGYSIASMELHTIIFERGGTAREAQQASVSASIPAEPRAQPDLSLLITEVGSEIGIRLQSATREFDGTAYPVVKLATSSREYFADFCRKIENLPVDTDGQRAAAARKLGNWGVDMIEKVLPAELRATLWTVRDRIGSVQITSDEAWIPWEVCRLVSTNEAGSKVEGPFFAEAFDVTRWLHGAAPPRHFRFGEWALVVPKDSGLPNAAAEESFIQSLASPDRKVTQVAANFCELTAAMESEIYQAWHFCGHARAGEAGDADQAAIELDDRDSMTADLFSGTVENALRTGPFVFLNACQSARGGLTLTGVGGWVHRFIKPASSRFAAGAFLGSYWSVYDAAALAFTMALYKGLIHDGKAIGAAVRHAREAVRTPQDPLTWLAYTVYADPLATVESR